MQMIQDDLTAITVHLQQPTEQERPEWSHMVLVAPSNAEYWPRLGDEFSRARDYYDSLRHIEPPTDRDIGQMPLLVAYQDGKPVRSWVGLRNVSEALSRIVRGEMDATIFASRDGSS